MNDLDMSSVLRSSRLIGTVLLVVLIGVGAVAIGLSVYLLLDFEALGRSLSAQAGHAIAEPRVWQAAALTGLVLAGLGTWFWALWAGRAVFVALARADLEAAGAAARRTARALWVLLLVTILVPSLATVVSSWHFPAGERALSISLGTSQVSTILAALLATFLSHGLAFCAELWRDHQRVI